MAWFNRAREGLTTLTSDLREVVTDMVAESESYDTSEESDVGDVSVIFDTALATPDGAPASGRRQRRSTATPLSRQRALAAGERVATPFGLGTVAKSGGAGASSIAVELDWAAPARCYVQIDRVTRSAAAEAQQQLEQLAWLMRCHAQVCALLDGESEYGLVAARRVASPRARQRALRSCMASAQKMEGHELALRRFVARIKKLLEASEGDAGGAATVAHEAALLHKISELQLERAELVDRVESLAAASRAAPSAAPHAEEEEESSDNGDEQLAGRLRVAQQRLDASESRVRVQASRLNALETLGDDLAAAKAAAARDRRAAAQASAAAAELKEERDAAVAAMDESNDALIRAQTKLSRTSSSSAAQTHELDELEQSNREYVAALHRLRADNAKTRESNVSLRKQLDEKTSGQLEKAEDEAAALGGQVDELSGAVTTQRETIAALRERLTGLIDSEHRHYQRASVLEEQVRSRRHSRLLRSTARARFVVTLRRSRAHPFRRRSLASSRASLGAPPARTPQLTAIQTDQNLRRADLEQSEEELVALQAVLRQFRSRKAAEVRELEKAYAAQKAALAEEHAHVVVATEESGAVRAAEWEREAERARTQLERAVLECAELQKRLAAVRSLPLPLPFPPLAHASLTPRFPSCVSRTPPHPLPPYRTCRSCGHALRKTRSIKPQYGECSSRT